MDFYLFPCIQSFSKTGVIEFYHLFKELFTIFSENEIKKYVSAWR